MPYPCHFGNIFRRLDAENRNPKLVEVRKQVAIIAGYLDDETPGSELKAFARTDGECTRMLQPAP